jgi:hypothetical protein
MPCSDLQTTAIALYSGGLDSTLACRVVAEQGIRVAAVKFVSPFFGYDLLAQKESHIKEVKEAYDINITLVDVTDEYLKMLRSPAHGYGKNFNPCIDCKILLLTKAREMMPHYNASFLITGEVVGQRPMSQRHDTLRVIERDSGCEDFLVRPLCAKLLQPTKPELEGLVDREQLLDFNGRTRVPQIKLAERYGITDYPSPAGGCALTDPILSKRVREYYEQHHEVLAPDICLLMVGRHFHLPGGGWLIMGRREEENKRVAALYQTGDFLLKLTDRPGPTGLLRYAEKHEDLHFAAGLLMRYGNKAPNLPKAAHVLFEKDGESTLIMATALDDKVFQS